MLDLSTLDMPADLVAARRHSIGASDLPIIMGSDESRLLRLWDFKRGGEPDDLSDVLPVILGKWTEPFNLALFARRYGEPVKPCKNDKRGILSATPDGLVGTDNAVIDAKHVGPYKTEAEIGAYYAPQLFAQMYVFCAPRAFLSVIRGNSDFFWLEYAWDEAYGQAVYDAAAAFWQCVQSGEPPVPLPPPPAPKPVGVVEVDMTTSNAWATHAGEYQETILAADRHEQARKELKLLVPSDASKAFGHGIEIRRAKNGSLRFYEGETE